MAKKQCKKLASKVEQTPTMSEQDKKWETEDDVRALKRVAQINKDSDRLARVKKFIKEEKEEISAIDEEYLGQIGLKKGNK